MTELKLELKCAECGGLLEGRGVSKIDGSDGFFVRAMPCETCVSAAERGHMRENRVLSADEALEWVRMTGRDLDPAERRKFLAGLGAALLELGAPAAMVESHEGEVVWIPPGGGSVTVAYELPDDDLMEHRYERGQFADGRLPRKGARLAVHTCVVELPDDPDEAPQDGGRL